MAFAKDKSHQKSVLWVCFMWKLSQAVQHPMLFGENSFEHSEFLELNRGSSW